MNNFDDEIIRIMIAAGFCSLVLGVLSEGWKWGWIEGCSIFFAVAILIALTSVNNYAHEQSFQLFKGETALDVVRTYRGGRLYLLDPEELMVGDIVEVMGGDRLGVDGLLISCEDLLIDESEITGEAVEVKKRVPYSYDRNEGADPFILSSSRVTSGVGKMVVLAVGEHSYYGSLAAKMDE
jgi:Ca2+-transporting ATPase